MKDIIKDDTENLHYKILSYFDHKCTYIYLSFDDLNDNIVKTKRTSNIKEQVKRSRFQRHAQRVDCDKHNLVSHNRYLHVNMC